MTSPAQSWFHEAKLGVMISWGIYSVPAWAPLDPRLHLRSGAELVEDPGPGPWDHLHPRACTPYAEWYQNSISITGSPAWFYHQAAHPGLTYESFATEFESSAANVDVASWVDLCLRAGAKYVVPLAKFHDGYVQWPSAVPHPRRGTFGTATDWFDRLAEAARRAELRLGVYYSGGIDWTFGGLPVPPSPTEDSVTPQSDEYAQYADDHIVELCERYRPDLLWNDIGYPRAGDLSRLREAALAANPSAVMNDRFSTSWISDREAVAWGADDFSRRFADFVTPEYELLSEPPPVKWELVRGIGWSFAFNRQEDERHTMSGAELAWLLARVVARGGNLLIGIGPDVHGRVSPHQAQALLALGRWLEVVGDAVYGTDPGPGDPRIAVENGGEQVTATWTSRDGVEHLFVPEGSVVHRAPGLADVAWLTSGGRVVPSAEDALLVAPPDPDPGLAGFPAVLIVRR